MRQATLFPDPAPRGHIVIGNVSREVIRVDLEANGFRYFGVALQGAKAEGVPAHRMTPDLASRIVRHLLESRVRRGADALIWTTWGATEWIFERVPAEDVKVLRVFPPEPRQEASDS